MENDFKIFGSKKYSDLLKEIHTKSKTREEQITTLIGELKPYITSIGEATIIVPLIAKYMEMGIKNDDNLIKLAGLVHKASQSNKNDNDSMGLSEDEKRQLFSDIKKLGDG